MKQAADFMKNTAKRLADLATKAGSIAFLFDAIGHIERDEATIKTDSLLLRAPTLATMRFKSQIFA